jgi:hypothetical protein
MNIGAGARQHDAVDHVEQGGNVGDLGTAGEDQRQGTGYFGDGAKVSLPNRLDVKATFEPVRIPDHTDNRLPSHAPSIS